MTKYIIIVFIAFLLACNNTQSPTSNVPSQQELTKIIEAVIYQDSLPVFKVKPDRDTAIVSNRSQTAKDFTSYPLSINLRKLKVIAPDTTKAIPEPINKNVVSIFSLLEGFKLVRHRANGKNTFSEIDYSYLLFQNNVLENFVIKSNFLNNLLLTTSREQQQKWKQGIPRQYYDLTIPILAKDGKKAYVEVTYNCSGLCGGATAIYLIKKGENWKIAHWKRLWIS